MNSVWQPCWLCKYVCKPACLWREDAPAGTGIKKARTMSGINRARRSRPTTMSFKHCKIRK